MQTRTHRRRQGQRDRARRHADVDRGPARPTSASIATIHAALDAGVTLIDTADAYHLHADEVGHNETLIAEALASLRRRHRPTCSSPPRAATCAPATARGPSTARPSTSSGRLRGVAAGGSASRRSGSTSSTGPTPKVPYAESVGALARPARRGQDPDGGHLQRQPGPDPAGQRDPRRPAGLGAEPVLAGVPLAASRSCGCATSSASRSCRGARSAASRKRRRARRDARAVRRGRRRRTASARSR